MDLLCVQETRWKGEKARCIGGGYKMWYCGSKHKKMEEWRGNHIKKGACGQDSGVVHTG